MNFAVMIGCFIASIGLWFFQIGTLINHAGGFEKVSNFDIFGVTLMSFILAITPPVAEFCFKRLEIIKGFCVVAVFLLFAAGTIPMTVSRYGEVKDHQNKEVANSSEVKKLLEAELAEAKQRVKNAEAEVLYQTRNGGCKDNCKAWQNKQKDAEARVKQLTTDLTEFIKNNTKIVPSDTRVAQVLNIDPEVYNLYQPLVIPVATEIGIWAFLWVALSYFLPKKEKKESFFAKFMKTYQEQKTKIENDYTALPVPAFVATPVVEETYKTFDEQVVVSALKKAGVPVNNNYLAQMMGVSAAEATRRVQSVGHLVTKVRNGQEVLISLK